jgi:hypothetical protein
MFPGTSIGLMIAATLTIVRIGRRTAAGSRLLCGRGKRRSLDKLSGSFILKFHLPRTWRIFVMSSSDPQNIPMFRIDVSADSSSSHVEEELDTEQILVALLRQVVANQERQNVLLKEMNDQLTAAQRQRAHELGQWKEANPELAQCCRAAAETLSRVQTQFLQNLTEEVSENEDCLVDGEFMMNEFVDRFGPRLAHLNGVLQVLSQLSTNPAAPRTPR